MLALDGCREQARTGEARDWNSGPVEALMQDRVVGMRFRSVQSVIE